MCEIEGQAIQQVPSVAVETSGEFDLCALFNYVTILLTLRSGQKAMNLSLNEKNIAHFPLLWRFLCTCEYPSCYYVLAHFVLEIIFK